MQTIALLLFNTDKADAESHLVSNISDEAGMQILGLYTPEQWDETMKAIERGEQNV